MKFTEIKISGLKDGNHEYHFSLDNRFLDDFSRSFFDFPELEIQVLLGFSETMIKAEILVQGEVQLICDRSLDTFRHPVSENVIHFFKFGEEEKELSDELDVISKERVQIDLDQLIYDSVALSLPSKRLHPRFLNEDGDENDEGIIVYSSIEPEENLDIENTLDPRWEKLKDLNRQ